MATIAGIKAPYFPNVDAELTCDAPTREGQTNVPPIVSELTLRDSTYGNYASLAEAQAKLGASTAGANRHALAIVQTTDGHFIGQKIESTWNDGPDTWHNEYAPVDLEGPQATSVRGLVASPNSGIVGLIDGQTFVAATVRSF